MNSPREMNPIHKIRREVFGVSQAEFGEIAGTTQASVSRWENAEQEPGLEEMARIREAARARDIEWDDRWFFEGPPVEAKASA